MPCGIGELEAMKRYKFKLNLPDSITLKSSNTGIDFQFPISIKFKSDYLSNHSQFPFSKDHPSPSTLEIP